MDFWQTTIFRLLLLLLFAHTNIHCNPPQKLTPCLAPPSDYITEPSATVDRFGQYFPGRYDSTDRSNHAISPPRDPTKKLLSQHIDATPSSAIDLITLRSIGQILSTKQADAKFQSTSGVPGTIVIQTPYSTAYRQYQAEVVQ